MCIKSSITQGFAQKARDVLEELNFQAKPLSTLRSENRPIKNPGLESQCLDFVRLFTTEMQEEGEMPYLLHTRA